MSPFIRGMMLYVVFDEEKGGIGLTAREPKNRKSLHWERCELRHLPRLLQSCGG